MMVKYNYNCKIVSVCGTMKIATRHLQSGLKQAAAAAAGSTKAVTSATAQRSMSTKPSAVGRLDKDQIKSLPKVSLHDHLDGGVRSSTIIDIAKRIGHPLPSHDADELAQWFYNKAHSSSLESYLETFEQTISVMQTEMDLIRIASETVHDLAEDGIIYGEIRYAPKLFTRNGLTINEVIQHIEAGFAMGIEEAKKNGHDIVVKSIVCAMRQDDHWTDVAKAAVEEGVVGFDIAGPEFGHPATKGVEAFQHAHAGGLGVTAHAGETPYVGFEGIEDTLSLRPHRLGHGVRVADDIDHHLSKQILDTGTVLEMCPASNIGTGIIKTYEDHPIDRMHKAGFKVTLNTDNRLMSNVTLTDEMYNVARAHDWTAEDLHRITHNAIHGAFVPEIEKEALRARIDAYYREQHASTI